MKPTEKGLFPIVFNIKDGHHDRPMVVPCGQCSGCRYEQARQWAVRCVHEGQLHDANCFITLTFNAGAMVRRGHTSVAVRDLQSFWKRLRKRLEPVRIKYLCSSEYGDDNGRPHYHAVVFGWYPADAVYWMTSKSGERLYRSATLEKAWTCPDTGLSYGFSSVGALTFQSAQYVAKYVMKKARGISEKNGNSMMRAVLHSDGRIEARRNEFSSSSNGIGEGWFERYKAEYYLHDSVVVDGREQKLPRYYDRKMENIDATMMRRVKGERKRRAQEHAEDQTDRRLYEREVCFAAKTCQIVRSLSGPRDEA